MLKYFAPTLKSLVIEQSNLKIDRSVGMEEFTKHSGLLHLDLRGCVSFVMRDWISLLSAFPMLESLYIASCHINPTFASLVANLKNCRVLFMHGCVLSDDFFRTICNMPKLEELSIPTCQNVTDFNLSSLSSLQRLQKLDLTSVQFQRKSHLTRAGLLVLGQSCAHLRYFMLSCMYGEFRAELQAAMPNCTLDYN